MSGPTESGTPATRLPAVQIAVAGKTMTAQADAGAVVIGREEPAHIRVPIPSLSRVHVRIEPADGHWVITDAGSKHGTFLDGRRIESVAVEQVTSVRLGDPAGIEVTVAPAEHSHSDPSESLEMGEDTAADVEQPADPDIARAGLAVMERREQLGFSQRRLAEDRVVSQTQLVKLERGTHWPRPGTLAKIESYLRWPPGTIARIRGGELAPDDDDTTEVLSPTVQVAVLIDASEIALHGVLRRVAQLPPTDSATFTSDISALLAELRRLERTITTAARTTTHRPELLGLLGHIRAARQDMLRAATRAPGATLGQRLATARLHHHLSAAEVATHCNITIEEVDAAEAEQPVRAPVTAALELLVAGLTGAGATRR
ncbi:FHA domain-containing protein (plasmid) [Mycobacterium sp. C3-094]|uniref:FHA domain-containing protein n=1 Tax=Mycobacterium sp. PSTR-4-N TaxID=2917745 RepID=UPI001F150F0A|nr:FHA domain-containing protein [Mycobacterium sp. PSTR-4-N]MCG7594790.1 FHA domain-containing protein [Mycobacterium sp. PSTR-4-N]